MNEELKTIPYQFCKECQGTGRVLIKENGQNSLYSICPVCKPNTIPAAAPMNEERKDLAYFQQQVAQEYNCSNFENFIMRSAKTKIGKIPTVMFLINESANRYAEHLFLQGKQEGEAKAEEKYFSILDACKNVVDTYEFDGMEQMRTRDEVFYKTCKKAINGLKEE